MVNADISIYRSFEINPVKIVGEDLDGQIFAKCEENDPDLYMWSVYGRKQFGLFLVADALYDFSRKDLAEKCCNSLNSTLKGN